MTLFRLPYRQHAPPARRFGPCLEALETRCVPTTVTNLDNAGAGSLRQAILETPSGGTVDFQPGLMGAITLLTGQLTIDKDLTIAGPGAEVITVSGNNASRVFEIVPAVTVAISGVTVADGWMTEGVNASGGILNAGTLTVTNCIISRNSAYFPAGSGGGIRNTGMLTVTDSTISGNSALEGGGLHNGGGGTMIVTDSIISGNSGFFAGGGITNSGGTLIVTNCIISNNSSDRNEGGGIHNNPGTLIVTRCIISRNSAGFLGGGITNGGTLTVTESILNGNSVRSGAGGGIYNFGTAATVTGSTISGNSAPEGGGIGSNSGQFAVRNTTISGNSAGSGGGISNSGRLTVTGSTISGNSGIFFGGGIRNGSTYVGAVTVTESTISGNSVTGETGAGGGIYNTDGTVTITGSIISNNSAPEGGGIGNKGGAGDQFAVRNAIIAGNAAPVFPDVSGALLSQGHNLVGIGDGGSGFHPTDLVGTAEDPINPQLEPLDDYGGPTRTHRPRPGSPVLNAGDNTGAPKTDQRGYPRIVGRSLDIGAVELQPAALGLPGSPGPPGPAWWLGPVWPAIDIFPSPALPDPVAGTGPGRTRGLKLGVEEAPLQDFHLPAAIELAWPGHGNGFERIDWEELFGGLAESPVFSFRREDAFAEVQGDG